MHTQARLAGEPPALPEWRPEGWMERPAAQQPRYRDPAALAAAVGQLAQLPPIVVSWEIELLREEIAAAQRGERFVLQGGDCAETFADCVSDQIAAKLKILLQMSLVLLHGLKKPVVRIGRIAGQYAKPRSADSETREGQTLPSYRGDLVNRPGFSAAEREPDPLLLLRGYERAALTLNFVRALVDGGFADLHHPEYWELGFMDHSPYAAQYRALVQSISDSLDFFEAISGARIHETDRAPFYASHEALVLHYEQAQTRFIPRSQRWYNLSTHLPWIGMRTADVDGAHVEFHRGIANPVGVKIGPGMTPEWLRQLVEILNPACEAGRLVLIHRLGAGQVERHLPALIEAVRATGSPVLWISDPMHGNTESTASGYKTRRFENIVAELEQSFQVHAALGSYLGGVHFELTGEDVTECIGGARGLAETDLVRAYRSQVDPRLNYEQALELAMRIAGHARRG